MNLYFTSTDLDWLTEANGRGWTAEHTTKQWGAIHQHPARAEWCVEIPQEWLARMAEIVTVTELEANAAGPFTREVMEADGWFASQGGQP